MLLRSGLKMTEGLVRRRYTLGVGSIIRLFGDLQAYISDLQASIEDLSPIKVSEPERLILAQKAEIKRLARIIRNKGIELTEVYQLNHQLQQRIRELEKALETEVPATQTVLTEVRRDSHNSNQPPSLDLPWNKPKRTRSLRKQSGRASGRRICFSPGK